MASPHVTGNQTLTGFQTLSGLSSSGSCGGKQAGFVFADVFK
jgi:hypothetical protein